jgi:hypothetical protein
MIANIRNESAPQVEEEEDEEEEEGGGGKEEVLLEKENTHVKFRPKTILSYGKQ